MMLRTTLIFVALATATAGHAAELWCMPDTLCRANGCKSTTNEEMSVRLKDVAAQTSTLRTQAEDVVMTRTKDGDVVQWEGVNEFGGKEYLAWRQSNGEFTYLVRWDDGESTATGLCEVQ